MTLFEIGSTLLISAVRHMTLPAKASFTPERKTNHGTETPGYVQCRACVAPCQLPFSVRQLHSGTGSDSPLCTYITPSLFYFRLKTYLFHNSYPHSFTSSFRTASTDLCMDRFF